MINKGLAIVLIAFVMINAIAKAENVEVDPQRFAAAIQDFDRWDAKNSFPDNAILLVGSSSIRMWSSARSFPDHDIINRGFGGSHISDVIHYLGSVVEPYNAAKIFLYAGDNDVGGGKSAERVLADFRTFVQMVRADSPESVIHFLSIKPSDARWEHWPEMQRANDLINTYSRSAKNVVYVDMASTLLGKDGKPKAVFIEDGLHLNEWGYELWTEALRPYLD